MKDKIRQKSPEKVWTDFQTLTKVSDEQLEQFKQYEALLSEWNRSMSLTAIQGTSEIVSRHFCDSLVLREYIDLSSVGIIADVGSGAGFPGVPLKILFPHLGIILIEVTRKKQRFLRTLIDQLGLKGIEVCEIDWRTFLRTTSGEIDYFLARASIDPAELCRVFKPGCPYKDAQIVYWAATDWEAGKKVAPYIRDQFLYKIKRTQRKLVLLGREKS